MGQSMKEPIKSNPQRSQSRLSARSLHRNSRHSPGLEKKGSLSASKLQHNSFSEGEEAENTLVRKGQLQILSTHQDFKTSKHSSKLLKAKESFDRASQSSPKFHQDAEAGRQYGFEGWGGTSRIKRSEDTPSDRAQQHQVTISFSKGRNNNNVFQEENEDRKENIRHILLQEPGQIVNQIRASTKADLLQNYDPHQIQKISATRSIYSDTFKLQSHLQAPDAEPQTNKASHAEIVNVHPSMMKKEKIRDSQLSKHQQQFEQRENRLIQTLPYNDYDCTEFKKAADLPSNRSHKLCSKMTELKEKIASRTSVSQQKEQLLNKSIKRLSNSFRHTGRQHYRDQAGGRVQRYTYGNILNDTVAGSESRNEYQIEEPQTHSKQKIILENPKVKGKLKKEKVPHAKDEMKKVKSRDNLGKTAHSSKQSSHQPQKRESKKPRIVEKKIDNHSKLKEKQAKGQQAVIPKGMETSFTDMVKKQHYGYKHQRKATETIPNDTILYSQIQDTNLQNIQTPLFASTCVKNSHAHDYDLECKARKENSQLSELKLITRKLNNNQNEGYQRPRNRLKRNSDMTGYDYIIGRNRTLDDQPRQNYSRNELNKTEATTSGGECMLREALRRQREGKQWMQQERRKYRSTDHSSKSSRYKSKLLVF